MNILNNGILNILNKIMGNKPLLYFVLVSIIISLLMDFVISVKTLNNNTCLRNNNLTIKPFTLYIYNIYKDFPKERYNTYAKSCNSNLYTKYPSATYSGLLLRTMCCL